VVLRSSRAVGVQKFAIWLLVALSTAPAALAVPNFTPQQRVGYTTGINGNLRWRRTGTGTSIFCFRSTAR